MSDKTAPTIAQAKRALLEHREKEPYVPLHLRYLTTPEWRAYEEWNIELHRLVNDLRRASEAQETITC